MKKEMPKRRWVEGVGSDRVKDLQHQYDGARRYGFVLLRHQLEIIEKRISTTWPHVMESFGLDLKVDELQLDVEHYYTVADRLFRLMEQLLDEPYKSGLANDQVRKLVREIRNNLGEHAYGRNRSNDPYSGRSLGQREGFVLRGGSSLRTTRDDGHLINFPKIRSVIEKYGPCVRLV
jgi:hypothetical protein